MDVYTIYADHNENTDAHTFVRLMSKFMDKMVEMGRMETYRITRRRREFLDTEYADAQRGADAAFDGSNKIRGIQSAIYHSATQARIDAIRDMALPVDKRTTILGTPGPDDAQLKQDMKTARKTQQRIKLAQRTV